MKDAGIAWFQGLGFRPAVLTPPHRADQVDPARLIPAPDADLAWLCGKGPCLDTLKLTYPGGADFYGALANDLSPAAVPLPASASLLIAAVAAFAIIRRRA